MGRKHSSLLGFEGVVAEAVVEANQPRKKGLRAQFAAASPTRPSFPHVPRRTKHTVESQTVADSPPLFPTLHAFTVLGRWSPRAVRRHHRRRRRRRRKVGIFADLLLPFSHPEGNMSSLAAARADNFYYPPEWSPKKGGLNKFHGQHALRERARKLDQGILIIRFEMPFNIWCGGCNSMIAKGVRFNAEKKQVGNYYSTKIWSFTMKSPCCKHEIVIQTDPKNTEYVIISGAQKKTEDFDVEDAETLLLPADEDRDKLADPMYRLEHQEEDLRKKKEAEPVLVRLQRLSDSRHSDDYALNRALRDRLRSQKKRVAEEKKSARKMGLGVRLLPPSAEDATAAASVQFASKFEKTRKDKRAAIKAASIFPGSSSSASNGKLDLVLKRRNIKAGVATALMAGRVKPSSWQSAGSASSRTRMPVLAARK